MFEIGSSFLAHPVYTIYDEEFYVECNLLLCCIDLRECAVPTYFWTNWVFGSLLISYINNNSTGNNSNHCHYQMSWSQTIFLAKAYRSIVCHWGSSSSLESVLLTFVNFMLAETTDYAAAAAYCFCSVCSVNNRYSFIPSTIVRWYCLLVFRCIS